MTGDPRIPRESAPLPASTDAHALQATEENKAALRRALASARRAIDPAQKALWDAAIARRVLAWWRSQALSPAATLGVYWPLRGEPELSTAYAELAASGVRLVLPVVLARHTALGFAHWTPGEEMVKDAMGVAVPAQVRAAARPDALLVPCLGFNALGCRLGYGGGYYDRTLEALPRPATAGVAYSLQLARFEVAPHDVALDTILTEAG